jgi:hypothetical protein
MPKGEQTLAASIDPRSSSVVERREGGRRGTSAGALEVARRAASREA